jgi:dihydroxyacetone kinase
MADVAIQNEAHFSELDGVMGDADFGVSLAAGFKVVKANWASFDHSSIGSALLDVSKAITANTGGTSGPVWGTLFMRTGLAFRGRTELTLTDIVTGLRSAIEGIMKRGGAQLGDKTLVDALDAIATSLADSDASGQGTLLAAFAKAADAAYAMRETSKGWIAKRGRQANTGERSIDTYDPGIVAVGDMAQAIVTALSA